MPKSSRISPTPVRGLLLALLVGTLVVAGVAPRPAAAAVTSTNAKDRKASSSLHTRRPRRAVAKGHGGKSVQIKNSVGTGKKGTTTKHSAHEVTAPTSTGSGKTGSGKAPTTPSVPTTTESPTVTPTPESTPVTETAPTTPTAPITTPTAPVETANVPLMASSFEKGLTGWNTAGVGEVTPTVDSSMAREGSDSLKVLLTGNQSRSELIFGGNGSSSSAGTAEFHPGDEYWYGFSFYINQMVYGQPGAHNLIMQFKSNGEGSPLFGLQLWNYAGKKGLWSSGTGMEVNKGGERFLAPAGEQAWHDVQIHFRASETGTGFYEVFLDGTLIDSHTGVTNIVPGAHAAYIKDGIYRNGETAAGTSEIHLDAAKLGKTQASVLPS